MVEEGSRNPQAHLDLWVYGKNGSNNPRAVIQKRCWPWPWKIEKMVKRNLRGYRHGLNIDSLMIL